ncbi:MAG: S8 family serine peptidase [Solirubrobacterales bacterium]|nr:S8 family serine peptidase [Solirubrobacterales bacterium]
MWRRLVRGRWAAIWLVVMTAWLGGAVCAAAMSRPPASGPAAAKASVAFPNDPGFAGCELQDPITGCQDNEQWDLFGPLPGNDCPAPGNLALVNPHPDGGLPCWALHATDPQRASGVNMTGAWAQGNLGRPDVLIAYIEGGVNYDSDSIKDGLDSVFLDRGELPWPEDSSGRDHHTFDLNGDGRFDIRDWAQDPRVNPPCPPGVAPFVHHEEGVTRSCVPGGHHQYLHRVHVGGVLTPYLSPEDLIAVFGDCRIVRHRVRFCRPGYHHDNDGNGYPNDISGWNFDRNNNDPQTEDRAYNHAPSLISLLGGEANDDFAGAGVCRECMVVPVKDDAEPLGRSDRWGEAILYATDLGATAISSVVVGYNYSSFSQEAVDYAYDHGVLLSLDSNDFDAMDHTDGMLFSHVFPGNSLTEDTSPPATQWFRARSNVTSYGTHSIFSGEENSTSGATPFQAGMLAMVQSAALDARHRGIIPDHLTPDEVKQVLMDTASPVIPQTQAPGVPHQWPGNPGSATDATHTNWSTQYGYGRPDLGAAARLVLAGRVPPTAEIASPSWYQYVDPARQRSLTIAGSLAPSRWRSGGRARWWLEWALGANPSDTAFRTIASGVARRRLVGRLGALDLEMIPRSYYAHLPGSTLPPDGPEQYTLTLRLRVVDAGGLKAEDRRTIGVRHDPALLSGFPRRTGGEIAAGPSYVDLEGGHRLDLVYATADGDVNALRPDGSEVPGFPVFTNLDRQIDPANPENLAARAYRTVPALRDVHDPVVGIAVGDLFGNGTLDVVATTSNADVYAWNSHGRRLRGFPVSSARRYWTLPVPTPAAPTPHSRLPARGAWAPPVLASLEAGHRLDILMSAFDGHVYAWRGDGRAVPGWPVEVKLPAADFARLGVDESRYIRDSKLMYAVAVGNVLHTRRPQVFASSFECDGAHPAAFLYGIWGDGNGHPGGPYLPGWPVRLRSVQECYDQSIDFVGEGTSPPVIGNFGAGALQVLSSPVTGPVYVINGDGTIARTLSLGCSSAACAPNPPYRPSGDAVTITLTGQGGLGDLMNTGTPQFLQSSIGAESLTQALDSSGQAALPQVYEKAWNVGSSDVLSGFPVRQDGFPFFDAPLAADLAGDGTRQVIEGNDSYWIHAWDIHGGEAPGFPKYTGQWPSFSGVVGDATMDGRLRYAVGTREGWLFVWRVRGNAALDNSWSHLRGDDYNAGLYGLDSRRPEAILDLRRFGRVLIWSAPGADYELGRASAYEVLACRDAGCTRALRLPGTPRPAAAGVLQKFLLPRLPHGTRYLTVRSTNAAGNLSSPGNVVSTPR